MEKENEEEEKEERRKKPRLTPIHREGKAEKMAQKVNIGTEVMRRAKQMVRICGGRDREEWPSEHLKAVNSFLHPAPSPVPEERQTNKLRLCPLLLVLLE